MDRAEIVELIGELRKELAGLPLPTPGPFWSVHEWISLAQTIIDLEKIVEESASLEHASVRVCDS
jgi:hypothetical protein